MLTWFDARAAQDFGAELARLFMAKVPPSGKVNEKVFRSTAQAALKTMARQITQFKQHHTLNSYKKAKLGNAFKWALKDAGYGDAYVDELTEWLLLNF